VLEIAPTHEPASPTLEAAAELHTAPPEGEAPAPAERALPEIEHAIGTTRQAVLDHFLDSEGDQSMSQIKAALANVLPGTVEAAVRREYEAGRLLRVAPGVYRLAPKPPEPPKAAPPTESPKIREDGRTTEQWFALLEAWDADPSSWNVERNGAPPGTPDHRIPWDIAMRFADRLRKRQERRRERDEADAKLRNQLLAACAGNYSPGPGLNDLAPIRLAMQVVPLDSILSSIRGKTDKKLYPGNEPATSWRSERLLRAIAQDYCRFHRGAVHGAGVVGRRNGAGEAR
jgi:hypothetical protein